MTNPFGFNLLLAVGSCALLGGFQLSNLLAGFLVGFIVLSITGPVFGQPGYFRKGVRTAQLIVYFAQELTLSSFLVAWDVLTPMHKSRPAIVAVPLDITNPTQIAVLANLISLTPGSLSLDVSRDRKTLYVHGMFVDDPEEFKSRIKTGFERRVREAMQ